MDYYSEISEGYDELHGQEQKKKMDVLKKEINVTPETNLLDVGCGTGLSSDWDCKVTGIDPANGLLKIANQKFINDGTKHRFIQASAEDLPFQDTEFDIVISVSAIHNFEDYKQAIKEMKRVGQNKFAITVLKKSSKHNELIDYITKEFNITKLIESEHDTILLSIE